MERRRGFRAAVCRGCGTAWSSRSARFCGRCGARLHDAGDGTTGSTARRHGFRHARAIVSTTAGRWAAIVVAVVAVAGGAHLVGSSTTLLEDRPTGTGGPDVELPDPTEVAGDTERSGSQGCVPEGCERWRIELDHDGWMWPGDGILIDTAPMRGGLDGVGSGEVTDGVGSGEVEDELGDGPHAVPVRVRAYAVASGELLWERMFRTVGGSMYGPQGAFAVEGLVIVAARAGLTALGAEDGEERWVSQVSGTPVSWLSIDGDLVVATGSVLGQRSVDTGHGELPLEGDPRVDLARIDGTSGEVLWRVDDQRLLGFGQAEVFVAGAGTGSVALLDPIDGTIRWERAWPDLDVSYQWPVTANGRVALTGEDGVLVASLATGDTIGRFDRDPRRPGPVELVGDLLVIGPPWGGPMTPGQDDTSQVTVVTLQDPEPRTEEIEGAVSVFPLFDHPSSFSRSEASALAMLLRDGDGYRLRVLDPHAEPRWERRWAVEGDDCCWSASPAVDGSSLVVVPHGGMTERIEVVSLTDGETLETVPIPVGLEPGHYVTWLGSVAVGHAQGAGGGVVVVGPGGRFSAAIDVGGGGFGIHSWDDGVVVLWLGRTLVGLDLEVLAGGS